MDRYIEWLNGLPVVLRWPAAVVSGLGALALLGAVTQFLMSGQSSDGDELPPMPILKRIGLQLVYWVFLGAVVVVAFALLGGPSWALLSLFHWSYALALLVGIPLGIVLTIGAYAVLEWVTDRKDGEES